MLGSDKIAPMSKTVICPGCGLVLSVLEEELDERSHAAQACMQVYGELTAYTLTLQDTDFLHQLAVDAYAAQHAAVYGKRIAITFAVVGLYLTFERQYTGRQVQRAHTLLANTSRDWPTWQLPAEKAPLTVLDVLETPSESRKARLQEWGQAVWRIWEPEYANVETFVYERLQLPVTERGSSGPAPRDPRSGDILRRQRRKKFH